LDALTQAEFNAAYIAHIVADSPEGPRGHPTLSDLLKADPSNLMLLCDRHHRLIDHEQLAEHPVERLRAMKRLHEDRIELLGSLTPNKRSHILLYGANVGQHSSPLTMQRAVQAILPDWYPAEARPIEIALRSSSITDRDGEYWGLERKNLERLFGQQVRPRLAQGGIQHLSVFAFAPQPLLMLLGSLLSDIPTAVVYQLHREPPDWNWQEPSSVPEFRVLFPDKKEGPPALVLSLSATVARERVLSVIPNATVWGVSVEVPHNDLLKSREQAAIFRSLVRRLLDRIKAEHGQQETIHIFPAVPVALAVELGRVRMPKADLPFAVYDEDRSAGGFRPALVIGD
jgi:hypothetical protein